MAAHSKCKLLESGYGCGLDEAVENLMSAMKQLVKNDVISLKNPEPVFQILGYMTVELFASRTLLL